MKMKWNITKLIAVGSMGALCLVLHLPGMAIATMVGIPGFGGIISIFVGGLFFSFCCLLIRKFGAATVMGFVFTVGGIPLPVFGPPGFLPKVIIGVGAGLIADSVYFLLKRNERVAAISIGGFAALSGAFLLLGLGLLFSIPGIEKLANLFLRPIVIAADFGYGAFAGWVSFLIFNRLRNTSVVRRIQYEKSE